METGTYQWQDSSGKITVFYIKELYEHPGSYYIRRKGSFNVVMVIEKPTTKNPKISIPAALSLEFLTALLSLCFPDKVGTDVALPLRIGPE